MVRFTAVLRHVPVIRFRKGGLGTSGPAPSASPSGAAASAAAPAASSGSMQSQSAAAMSTGAIQDIDLPLRYRRRPLSEEEINHINGGGIKIDANIKKEATAEVVRAVVKVHKEMLIEAAKEKETITLNVSLEKSDKRPSSHD